MRSAECVALVFARLPCDKFCLSGFCCVWKIVISQQDKKKPFPSSLLTFARFDGDDDDKMGRLAYNA
jgi:hypothetical protein